MPRYSTRIISDGGVLVFAMMLSNGLNFVYNAYLGRTLSFEEFGLVTLVNTFLFIASMFLGGFGSTINHRVAFLQSESGSHAASRFFLNTRKRALLVVALLTIIWILFSSSITQLVIISQIII
jgi:O-antigen/teichoic acid export membrane protein